MAVTKKLLKGIGLTDDQIESVFEAHMETVNGYKADFERLKSEAEGAAALKKELEQLKSGKDWKAEHDKLKKELDDYKAEVAGKEQTAKVKAAYKALLGEEKIDPRLHELIMKGTDFSGMKLDAEGKLENAEDIKKTISRDLAAYKVTTEVKGAGVGNPPGDGKVTKTREEIMAIKDDKARQTAIAQNLNLFS